MAAPRKSAASRPGRALLALVVLIIVVLAGILGKNAFSPGKWRHDFHVQLGLDLSSGTSVTLTAQSRKKVPEAYMQEAIRIMTARVNGAGFSGAQIQQQGSSNIVVTVPGKTSQEVINLVGTTAKLYFRQVLLIGAAGSTASPSSAASPSPSASPSASPSSSPTPSSSPPHSSSPSPSTSTSARVAGRPAGPAGHALTSRAALLAASKPKASKSATPKASSSATPSTSPSPSPTTSAPAANAPSGDASMVQPAVLRLFNKLDCNQSIKKWQSQVGYYNNPDKTYDDPAKQIVACAAPSAGYQPGTKLVLATSQVAGTEVTSAQAGLPTQNQALSSGAWQVNLSFNGKGSSAFGNLTSQMYSQYGKNNSAPLDLLAIELDGQVVSAPAINQGAITGGSAQITGSFTRAQASLLANQLSYGALPVNLTPNNIQSVSPELGHNQLSAGLIAAAIGLGLVVIYSFLYYRGLGLVSVSSLIVAAALAYGSVVLLSKYASSGFSLSLAGIAGLIVAIGITADSFVVFFERLRDEVRDGKSLRPAVESGWKRARRTILVSDTVSFLAALLLWYFSISDVKGFAFTLGLTTLIDVVVVFLFTKPMVTLLARTRFYGGGHRLSGLDPIRLGARAPWRSGLARTPSRTREA